MRKKLCFIAVIAMLLTAVQGYAQERRSTGRASGGGQRTERVSRPQTPSRQQSYNRSRGDVGRSSGTRVQPSGSERRGVATQPRVQNNSRSQAPRNGYGSRAPRPNHYSAPHHNHRPVYHHHHSYHHHHHRCIFDNWSWYYWGGYSNRFIRHAYYHNRYFDSLLGYYLLGAFDRPTSLQIGDLNIVRRSSNIKISTQRETSYLDLYRYQQLVYRVGNTTVEITTNYGYATVYFYDEYGNTATYRL